ncbi:hypothetical protein ZWY2020_014548 [Hordeum vulgare]|nr:hypothetical protein ZWY2020_014548 [Hordeum vulgare]
MPPQLLRLPAGSSGIFSSDAEYPRDAAGPLVERRLRAPAPGVESMATVRSQVRRCLILTEYILQMQIIMDADLFRPVTFTVSFELQY